MNPARFLILAMLLAMVPVSAGHADDDDEQDRARAAFERGEIRSLDAVLRAVLARAPGEVVDVELDQDDGRWIYEVKVLAATGNRIEGEIDAASLAILEVD